MNNTQKYIVRTYSAGVFYGEIANRDGKEVTMRNARQLWYWSGANCLMDLAQNGVKNPSACKFTVQVPEIKLTEAIEILPCSDQACEVIDGVKEWKA